MKTIKFKYFASILIVFSVILAHRHQNFYPDNLGAALLEAIRNHNDEKVYSLLKQGADPFYRDENGYTAIHYAVITNNLPLLQHFSLIEGLLEAAHTTPPDETPALLALRFSLSEVFQFLTSYPFSINDDSLHDAAKWGKLNQVQKQLQNNESIDMIDNQSRTPLYMAVYFGHLAVAKTLIDRGANVNIADTDIQHTPLHLAAVRGYTSIVKELLDKGANIESKTREGCTPLFYSVIGNHPEITKILIKHGAMINTYDDLGRSPLYIALLKNSSSIVEVLFTEGKHYYDQEGWATPLYLSIAVGNENLAKKLIVLDADITGRGLCGDTTLHHAAGNGFFDIAEMLLEKGEDINATNEFSETPIFYAIENDEFNMVKFLIEQGADINHQTGGASYNPLMRAISLDRLRISKLLINSGANINIQNRDGNTPLHLAILCELKEHIYLLLEAGANPDLKNQDGLSALDLSKDSSMLELFQ